jgi:processive 1,2-diacylglycerol beta-glucosyltransferase
MTPVVVCGSNERLRLRLEAVPGIIALGWRDDMDELIEAASCVIQNAGGMTSLESLAAGTPTLTYRAIAGHGTTNAAALASAGLIPWPADPSELETWLLRVLTSPTSFSLPQGAPSVLAMLEDSGLVAVLAPLVAA